MPRARPSRRERSKECQSRRGALQWRAISDLGSRDRLVAGALKVEFGRTEHRVSDVPELRVNRVVEQLVGGVPQVSEPGRASGPGAVADHPRDGRKMHEPPAAERVFEVDQLFAQLVELGLVFAVL